MKRIDGAVCAGLLMLMLTACSGSSSGDDDGGSTPPPPPITVGTPDAEVWAAGERWTSVVENSDRFDDCHTTTPLLEPYQCARGARSGSALGNAVHDWMHGELAAIPELRFPQRQVFDFAVFKPKVYGLAIGSGTQAIRPATFPWLYSGTTPAAGVSAELVAYNAATLLPRDYAGKIVMFDFEPLFNAGSTEAADAMAALKAAGALAAIGVGRGPVDQILAQTRDSTEGVYGLPTLIVSPQTGDRLQDYVGQTATLTLTADYETRPTRNGVDARGKPVPGLNTIAYLPGVDTQNIIVVGTPLNGILRAEGERAPGIGMFVYLARYFAQQARERGPLPYSIYFVASGGHEVYGYGLGRFLACLPTERVVAYVHLGAGLVYQGYNQIGTRYVAREGLHQSRNLTVSENSVLQAITNQTFSGLALEPLFRLPPSRFNPGEAVLAYRAGIPTVSISGTNPYFHTLADDLTQVYRPALEPTAIAYRDTVARLLQTDAAALRAANHATVDNSLSFTCPSALDALR